MDSRKGVRCRAGGGRPFWSLISIWTGLHLGRDVTEWPDPGDETAFILNRPRLLAVMTITQLIAEGTVAKFSEADKTNWGNYVEAVTLTTTVRPRQLRVRMIYHWSYPQIG